MTAPIIIFKSKIMILKNTEKARMKNGKNYLSELIKVNYLLNSGVLKIISLMEPISITGTAKLKIKILLILRLIKN